MSEVVVSQVAMASLMGASGSAAPEPTAQQSALFQQQLQAPLSDDVEFYAPSSAHAAGMDGSWRALKSDMGTLAEQYRADTVALESAPPSVGESPESGSVDDPTRFVEILERDMKTVSHMSYTMMSIGFLTTVERQVGETVHTLYQLS